MSTKCMPRLSMAEYLGYLKLKILVKALNYRLSKRQFETENHLYSLDDNFLYEFRRFRTLNHKLPIDSGRWKNVDRNMRICNLCDKNEIGDKFQAWGYGV